MDGTVPAVDGTRVAVPIPWPGFLGPRPHLKEVNLACWLLFLGLLIIPALIGYSIQLKRTGHLPSVAFGFTNFYGVGQIVNQFPPTLLYDYATQEKTFHQISPEGFGPSPYPPFVALFFSPLARLPFNSAYLIWTLISLGLYIVGLLALARVIFAGESLQTSLFLCFSLAYYPFFYCTLLNGRLSAIGVFAVGLAILFEKRAKETQSGLALSLLAYKPTLLLLIAPMLLLTRKFKTIRGFLVGVALLIALATAFDGFRIWAAYFRFSVWFGKITSSGGDLAVLSTRYVDCGSLSESIPGGRSTLGLVVLGVAAAVILVWLAVSLWISRDRTESERYLAWAATLTWTLFLNVYVPIYDSILIAISVALTIAALRRLRWDSVLPWFLFCATSILVLSWMSDRIANWTGVQVLSLLYAALGVGQLIFLNRATRGGGAGSRSPRAPAHAPTVLD